jgi:hypothetical protein
VDHDWTLGDVVDKFGPPEYIQVYTDCEEDCVNVVDLFYPGQGLVFESVTQGGSTGKSIVSEDLGVTRGVYFAPTTLEGMMSEVYFRPPDRAAKWLANIREWKGFED